MTFSATTTCSDPGSGVDSRQSEKDRLAWEAAMRKRAEVIFYALPYDFKETAIKAWLAGYQEGYGDGY